MKVIILAGGSGTRLWPLSRTNRPKQFLKLVNMQKSIFQISLERCLKLTSLNQVYIITNNNYKFLVLGQVEELGYKINQSNILIEPVAKNTLPATYYGVKKIQEQGDSVVLVLPSDHIIRDEEIFLQTVRKGERLIGEYLITFGIKPEKPHTGYGYIKPDKSLNEGYTVGEFIEKPDYKEAVFYLEKGYLWNSGMFMFKTDLFAVEVEKHCPEVFQAFQAEDVESIFNSTPSISIDYGVMEKSKRVAVLPMNIRWSDMGSFDSFYDVFPKDQRGNITFSNKTLMDSSNNLIYSDTSKLVSLIGINDMIIIDEKDALLICKREDSEKVKNVVEELKICNDKRIDCHITTYRPWGLFTILEEGLFYKIKRITVLPGKKLSYQLHHHRSEHWIVIKGTAKVTIEDQESFIRSGESTFVKSGYRHRLENPGKTLLEVIEVQLGEYLEEDDIVRIDDVFGRC
ncbi:mannose-1-phosphate guanylyltransferase/mannose-6-phosphate isomerase [Desulforamulus ruminis]|uniref:mannose-1-phosphate guanylyltransferase/mannose-6-phosphate isomerase n=1 Tax=Desulforamulus ruminis TaxID=1564 RepID=UPI002357285A|nr:mannose-1-phosphate guanylyltransferase/mannose-6-phosphate isomerase [Desulforamulus ruminis]